MGRLEKGNRLSKALSSMSIHCMIVRLIGAPIQLIDGVARDRDLRLGHLIECRFNSTFPQSKGLSFKFHRDIIGKIAMAYPMKSPELF